MAGGASRAAFKFPHIRRLARRIRSDKGAGNGFSGHRQDLDERVTRGLEATRRSTSARTSSTTAAASSKERGATTRWAGPACFRLDAHIRRLLDSARIYRMDPKYDAAELTDADLRHHQRERHSRVLHPAASSIAATIRSASTRFPAPSTWRSWCGNGARISRRRRSRKGSTSRFPPGHATRRTRRPAMAKSVANYANAQLIKLEAIAEGYAEGIALDTSSAT